jgi:Integrase core domain
VALPPAYFPVTDWGRSGDAVVGALHGKLQDEYLKSETFYSLSEASIVVKAWRRHYNHCNTVRPHGSLGYRLPALVVYRAGPFPLEQTQHMHQALIQLEPKYRPGQSAVAVPLNHLL